MRFERLTDPNFASLVAIPWFIPEGQNPLAMGWELYQRLKGEPENTFCLMAVENNIPQALLLAYVKDANVVWVWQAHAKSGFKYSRSMFTGLIEWARAKGVGKLRCGTLRGDALGKRYGFRPCGKDEMERII